MTDGFSLMLSWIFAWKQNTTYSTVIFHDDLNSHTTCICPVGHLPRGYVHELIHECSSPFLPSTSFSFDVPLICRVEWPERKAFWWLGSRYFPRKLEPPSHPCGDLLPHKWWFPNSVRVWMAWDPLRAMEQFLLPDFLAERRERAKTVSLADGSAAHIYCGHLLCVRLYWEAFVYAFPQSFS